MENNIPVVTTPVAAQSVAPLSPPTQPPQPPRSLKKVIVVIGIIFLLLVVVGVAFFLTRKSDGMPSSGTIPTQTVVSPTIPIVPTKSPAIEMTLEKGKMVPIPNSDVNIVYVGASVPNPNCFDCSTTTDITLQKGKEQKKLNFLCGGIAGTCTDVLAGFDYEVTLIEGLEATAKVKIIKQ